MTTNKRKSVIYEGMSILTVQHCLERRGVASVEVRLDGVSFLAQAHLHALRGPEGHVSGEMHRGVTLGEALDKVCQELDEAADREVCVWDDQGVLRGRYPNDAEGHKHALQHIRTTCRSGSSNFPK